MEILDEVEILRREYVSTSTPSIPSSISECGIRIFFLVLTVVVENGSNKQNSNKKSRLEKEKVSPFIHI